MTNQTDNVPPQPAVPATPRVSWSVDSRRKGSGTVVKMLTILVLVMLLLIPLGMIRSVLSERLQRRNEAVRNITSTWGSEQVICGPVLVVPYKQSRLTYTDQLVNGQRERVAVTETSVAQAYFLPADLKITGDLAPSLLHRGIYEAVVYSGHLEVAGRFARPSFEEWKVKPDDVMWEDAVVTMAISDLRGAKEALSLKWGNRTVPLVPGAKLTSFKSGVYARLGDSSFEQDGVEFTVALNLNGSRSISFVPVGTQNEARLTSSWADPSFCGAFLPAERKIGPGGFEATWHVSYYGRTFPQQWSSENNSKAFDEGALASAFGVDLIAVVDSYRLVERSIKYGILFIALVFTAFFLFEVLSPLRIHPFQYTLVGAALCLFYLALLSLSEVTTFGRAYLAGACAASILIALYSAKALKSFAKVLVIVAELAVIYGFLYVILQLQDYSLLFGTAGLFIALAIVMYATRNIDWYSRDENSAGH